MVISPPSFTRLAATRNRTLELIEGVDQEASTRRPSKSNRLLGEAGAWSLGEILDHVLRVFHSLAGEIQLLYELDAKGEPTVVRRTLKDYDVAPAFIPKSVMSILEPGFHLANVVSRALMPAAVREGIMRNRVFPIQNPAKWLPVAGRDIEEMRADLKLSFFELEDLLACETQKPLEELILSHTVFGSNTVPEVLGILDVHEAWHQQDLEALVAG